MNGPDLTHRMTAGYVLPAWSPQQHPPAEIARLQSGWFTSGGGSRL
jgi:hypothetical protein